MATIKKFDLEIHFLALELAPALNLSRHSNHLLGIDLVCPRPTIARKTSERMVALSDGAVAPEAPAWTDSVVFKETVSGRFGFAVTVSESLSDAAASAFLATGASTLVKLLTGLLGHAFPVAELADVAEIPFSALTKAVSKESAPATLVRGVLDMPGDPPGPGRTVVEVPLVAAKDIYRAVTRSNKGGTATTRRKLVAKGAPAGVCRLALAVL